MNKKSTSETDFTFEVCLFQLKLKRMGNDAHLTNDFQCAVGAHLSKLEQPGVKQQSTAKSTHTQRSKLNSVREGRTEWSCFGDSTERDGRLAI